MASDKDTLIEFGFSPIRAEKALRATQSKGLQAALDWLDEHQNDAGIDDPIDESSEHPAGTAAAEGEDNNSATEEGTAEAQAKSLKCNECGKLFKSPEAAEFHATKSGHQDFSESVDEVKPLTEEEKNEKLNYLKERLAEKRKQQMQKEKEEARANELIRRKAGQGMQEAREKLQHEEQLKAIQSQRKEKELDRIAKQRVKDQIEQDRKERAARREREIAERHGKSVEAPEPAHPSMIKAGVPKVSSSGSQARIQIRPMITSLADSRPITCVLDADKTLDDLIKFVKDETGVSSFHLATTFPRKTFHSHDHSKSLKELGLVPSAALAMIP